MLARDKTENPIEALVAVVMASELIQHMSGISAHAIVGIPKDADLDEFSSKLGVDLKKADA